MKGINKLAALVGCALLVGGSLTALAPRASAQSSYIVKQSAAYTIKLPDIVASSDHISGLTGQTGTVYLSRVNGSTGVITKAASTNNIVEIDAVNAPGQYTLTLTATETGTLGWIAGYYKAATSDPVGFTIKVVGYDPDNATSLGLTNLDAAVSSRAPNTLTTAAIAASLLATPGNLLATDASGRVLLQPTQTGVTIPTVTTVGSVSGNVAGITGVTFPSTVPSAAAILDTALTGHTTGGTVGGALQAAGSAGDPWATLLPGAYGAGTAGFIVGTDLNATMSSRLAATSYTAPPTTSQVAAAILSNPLNLLKTDTAGNITVGGYAAGQDPATLVLSATVDGTLTLKQAAVLSQSLIAGAYSVTRNSTNKTITVTYYRRDGVTVLATMVTNYTDSTLTVPTTRTVTYSNLP